MSPSARRRDLSAFDIQRQPDDTTCGPTCLHAVYRYFGDEVPLAQLLAQVPTLESGGTLGVLLATHALSRGYRATIATWNLQLFDPTWFGEDAPPLAKRLEQRLEACDDPRLVVAAQAYIEFLDAGGTVEFHDLEPALLHRFLDRELPILTGLSATFLYREARENPVDGTPDDIAGQPVGHFVVLTDYSAARTEVQIHDPLQPNPGVELHSYRMPIERVIGSIYLGVLTYDANLIVIEPPDWDHEGRDQGPANDAHDRTSQ